MYVLFRALIKDIEKLAAIDGYAAWRANEATALSDLVQRRLRYLQNPKDCSTARKLVCNLNKVCTLFLSTLCRLCTEIRHFGV